MGAGLTAFAFSLARLENQGAGAKAGTTAATLMIAGSETIKPWLVACAEAFMLTHRDVDVVVRGGGSSNGIAALLAGQVDLALSSRELTAAEIQRGAETGAALVIRPVAVEAIAIIVHPAVIVDQIDVPTLRGLLDGSINDWSVPDGGTGAVVVIGRESGSGTASVVESKLLDGRSLSIGARRLRSHHEVVDAVTSTAGAIGYADAQIARRHAPRVKLLGLVADSDTRRSTLPDAASIARGDYPLSRTLYVVGREPISGTSALLLDFCGGPQARPLLEAAGFLPAPAAATRTARP